MALKRINKELTDLGRYVPPIRTARVTQVIARFWLDKAIPLLNKVLIYR